MKPRGWIRVTDVSEDEGNEVGADADALSGLWLCHGRHMHHGPAGVLGSRERSGRLDLTAR